MTTLINPVPNERVIRMSRDLGRQMSGVVFCGPYFSSDAQVNGCIGEKRFVRVYPFMVNSLRGV